MKITINDKDNFKADDFICGFTTKEGLENLKFGFLASPELPFNVAMQLLQTMTHTILTAYMKQKPEAVDDIWDAYNTMASSLLNNLVPGKEIRMDVSEESILRAEKEIIEENFATLTPKQQAEQDKVIETIKKRMADSKKQEVLDRKKYANDKKV